MTPGLLKMYVSFIGIGSMFFSVILIYVSRYKLKGFWGIFSAIIAYILLLLAGLIILFVVLSGPVSE